MRYEAAEGRFSLNGRRMRKHYADALSQQLDPLDIQVIGPLGRASGLGQAARLSLRALRETGYSVNGFDFSYDHPTPRLQSAEDFSLMRRARINLLHVNPEYIPHAFDYLPDVFTGAYNVGYFFWELDGMADIHRRGVDLVDEIWTASDFGAAVFRPYTSKPITKAGLAADALDLRVDRAQARRLVESRYGVGAGDFLFFSDFDAFSYLRRKNPLGLLDAFQRAFNANEPVRLILKTHNLEHVVNDKSEADIASLKRICSEDRRVVLLNETMTRDELLATKLAADCYVSLHRSEGFGFGIFEAMQLGVPVVATGWSGNMEFCNAATAALVDCKLIPVGKDDYPHVKPGHRWGDPDIGSAVALLRDVRENQHAARQRAAAAKSQIAQRFNPGQVGQGLRARIEVILASGVRRP